MLQEVQAHFRLVRPLYGAGIFETEQHRQILREVPAAVMTGRLAVISGLVGCGKTVLLRRLEDELARRKIVVAKSLAEDPERTTLAPSPHPLPASGERGLKKVLFSSGAS